MKIMPSLGICYLNLLLLKQSFFLCFRWGSLHIFHACLSFVMIGLSPNTWAKKFLSLSFFLLIFGDSVFCVWLSAYFLALILFFWMCLFSELVCTLKIFKTYKQLWSSSLKPQTCPYLHWLHLFSSASQVTNFIFLGLVFVVFYFFTFYFTSISRIYQHAPSHRLSHS